MIAEFKYAFKKEKFNGARKCRSLKNEVGLALKLKLSKAGMAHTFSFEQKMGATIPSLRLPRKMLLVTVVLKLRQIPVQCVKKSGTRTKSLLWNANN